MPFPIVSQRFNDGGCLRRHLVASLIAAVILATIEALWLLWVHPSPIPPVDGVIFWAHLFALWAAGAVLVGFLWLILLWGSRLDLRLGSLCRRLRRLFREGGPRESASLTAWVVILALGLVVFYKMNLFFI